MLRTTTIALLTVSLITSAAVAQDTAEAAPGPFEYSSFETAWQVAQESHTPVLVMVSSEHCYYCKKMVAETMNHPQLVPAFRRLFETTLLDASRDSLLAQRFGVRAFPTTLVISPEGKLLSKLEGYIPPDKIGKRLNPVLRAYRDSIRVESGAVAQR